LILLDLNRRIDHAALKPRLTEKDVVTACRVGLEYNLFAVAVNPVWVKTAAGLLTDSDVKAISVAGFPLGANRTDVKVAEAVKASEDGAAEIDIVANIGWLIDGRLDQAESEIRQVRQELPARVGLKVIIEAGLLTTQQQVNATRAVINGGAQFVKTSTGFAGGATILQVKTLRNISQGTIEVKASGGIKTLRHCRQFLKAGATRLGTSSSVSIMRELLIRDQD
jgi:deoxyribose-phosphate aldolase